MTTNPLINALSATLYISCIVAIMRIITLTQGSKPDSAWAPVIFLSMLTFSVAVLGYLFFYQPLVLLIDGKKPEALNLCVQTIGSFGAITVLIALVLFSGII